MKNTFKVFGIVAFAAMVVLGFTACGNALTEPPDQPVIFDPPDRNEVHRGALRAEPIAAAAPATPRIRDSFIDGCRETGELRNWYVIDAGRIYNSLLMYLGPIENIGAGELTMSRHLEEITAVERSSTNTAATSIAVTEGVGRTVGLDTAIEASFSVGFDKIFTAGLSVGVTLTERVESTRSFQTESGRSSETSATFMEGLTRSVTDATQITIGREDPIGFYRVAWYNTSDVYFLISTSEDRQTLKSWDVIVAQRNERSPLVRIEFSPYDRYFDNTPTSSLIVFNDGFWRTLPPPEDSFTLTTTVNGGGRIERNPNGMVGLDNPYVARYNTGATVSLIAIPNDGYRFDRWTGTGAPTGNSANMAGITVTMSRDLELTANFITEHTLTTNVNVVGRGTITRSPDQPNYSPNTQVRLTANPIGRYRFANWTGDLPAGVNAYNPTITVTMNSNLTLTANFGFERNYIIEFLEPRSNQSRTLPPFVRYPATIEVYALGAGGGGQSGSRTTGGTLGTQSRRGTGGAGGGGAAAFMQFTIGGHNNPSPPPPEQVTFIVTVGTGGPGGNRDNGSSQIGAPGDNGGETRVNVLGHVLAVAGGRGGGTATATGGGGGGGASQRPPRIEANNWSSSPGGSGGSGLAGGGSTNNFTSSRGGTAGTISRGSINPFGGGLTMYLHSLNTNNGRYSVRNHPAAPGTGGSGGFGRHHCNSRGDSGHGNYAFSGGDGMVRIVVRWLEL